jgi:hypothetical protein
MTGFCTTRSSRGHGAVAPGDAFSPDPALEEAGDGQIDDPGPINKLANAAIPVARGLSPRQHYFGRRPGDPAIGRAGKQGLAAVVVEAEALLVEHSHQRSIAERPRGDLIDAVLGAVKDIVVADVSDLHGAVSPASGLPPQLNPYAAGRQSTPRPASAAGPPGIGVLGVRRSNRLYCQIGRRECGASPRVRRRQRRRSDGQS